ncbi:MAG TPA: ABC transporter ATP-binding protein [Clostridiales bacterium]|nr:ABC transporter ATP-binding protein [Clostridiales bacterium]
MDELKRKPKYSLFSNLKFILGNMWKWEKRLTVFMFLRSPFAVITPFIGIYLSKEVVDAVVRKSTPAEVLYLIAAISFALLACLIVDKYLGVQLQKFMMIHDFHYQMVILDKCIRSDYENMESAAGLTRISKAMEHCGYDISDARIIANVLSSLAANIIGAISYAAVLFRLSPWILLAVTLTTLSGFFALKITASWRYRNKDYWKVYDRKLNYLRENSGDFTRAKDIRLYTMTDWFQDVFAATLSDRMKWHKKEQMLGFGADGLRAFMSLLREGIAYGLLVFLIFANDLTAADFVFYFSVIGGFTTWLNGIVGDFDSINRCHLGFSEIREYLDYPDKSNRGPGIPLPIETFSIEFKNVSYRYQGSSEDTIKNLSFRIDKGEKIAIVGLNGAGKTTLVKLMCGLYNPTEGEILINGQPVNAYNREDYYSLFSVVFQEIFVMPMSIARNVSSATEDDTDRQRVWSTIALAGLSSKIDKLPEGIDTKLIKSVYDDAVDLSGGEMQKLALARALYKNGKALILDEPTAALDPIAESHIYMEYSRMTSGNTSVFISHRLASTQFCDRIFFMEKGRIIECGSHDELMSQKGKYYEMFEIQSHYYKDEVMEDVVA